MENGNAPQFSLWILAVLEYTAVYMKNNERNQMEENRKGLEF